ncbi:MAG: flagellin [Candidatus Eisenbacteria bacterium]|uniref:Flagellin n=1 Tax=Eiseniibacteriota bacterium TaxID=2212470 RepID=A0A7Y2E6W9_UNCEI|nr:flagellin [Candidatus Eisenbacteria bacterium]
MPSNDITLGAGVRQSLISQQQVSVLLARTTERLASGKRVNSPIDDAQAFFAAQDHRNRASDLAARKDAIGEAIQTVETADGAVEGITNLIEQAKGLLASARSTSDTAERASLATQYDSIRTQIDQLAGDSSYRGTNLLGSDDLTVEFNEDGSSDLTISGFDGSSSGLSIDAAAGSFATDTNIDDAETDLDGALTTLRTQSQSLSSNLGVITTREEFTTQLINSLQTGADNLTLSDPNEEGANMLALQTRQQLGVVALSLSSQAQSSVLSLF